MDVLRVEAALLRGLLPDLVLREGMQVVASVAERAGRHGIIVLAGTPLAAQLPDGVQPGDVLRLLVAETSPERVVLRIVEAPTAQAPLPQAVAVPLPGGASARIVVDERDAGRGARGRREGEGEHHEVRLTYTSVTLGAIELHVALAGDAVRALVRARAGAPYELAERHAAELSAAIGDATGKPAQVVVSPRHDPLDVYA